MRVQQSNIRNPIGNVMVNLVEELLGETKIGKFPKKYTETVKFGKFRFSFPSSLFLNSKTAWNLNYFISLI